MDLDLKDSACISWMRTSVPGWHLPVQRKHLQLHKCSDPVLQRSTQNALGHNAYQTYAPYKHTALSPENNYRANKVYGRIFMLAWINTFIIIYIYIFFNKSDTGNLLIIQSPADVTVTWSTAVHITTETPVLRLKGKTVLCTSTKTQTQNKYTHNALLPHTGRNFVQSQGVCSNSFLSEYHKDFLFGVCLEDYSCMLGPQTHTKERQKWSYTLTTENRKSFRGQRLERTWNKLFVCVYVCVFTHDDSLMGRRWGHSVPFYSGHIVVPPH